MSIASEINRLSGNVGDTLSALRNTGTSVPSGANSDSMAGLVSQYAGEVTAGKALVAAAVTEKGVETPADATFQQIAENVAAIASGGGGQEFTIQNGISVFQLPDKASAGVWVASSNRANVMQSQVKILDEMGNKVPFNLSTSSITTLIESRAVSGYYLNFVMPASPVSIVDESGGGGSGN